MADADLEALPQRAKSTPQPFPINFQPYTQEEGHQILQERIKHALKPNSITPKPSSEPPRSPPTRKTSEPASTSSSPQPPQPKPPAETESKPQT